MSWGDRCLEFVMLERSSTIWGFPNSSFEGHVGVHSNSAIVFFVPASATLCVTVDLNPNEPGQIEAWGNTRESN